MCVVKGGNKGKAVAEETFFCMAGTRATSKKLLITDIVDSILDHFYLSTSIVYCDSIVKC